MHARTQMNRGRERGKKTEMREEDKKIEINPLTDNGEIDATVTSRRTFEIHPAPVESGVRFADVVDHQARSVLKARAEEGPFAQHRLVGPVLRPAGVLVTSVVPGNKKKRG